MWQKIWKQWRYWREQDTRHESLSEEMQFHVESLTEEYVAAGMSRAAAREKALRQFGNVTSHAEHSRQTWIAAWLEDLWRDVLYALRGLRQAPAFALFAIGILGLGAGACATVYAVLDALVLRPLPVERPAELAWIANGYSEGLSGQTLQVNHILDMANRTTMFSGMAGYMAFYDINEAKFGERNQTVRATVVPVSQHFFPLLGVTPERGRQYTAVECLWGAPTSLMLSHNFWLKQFAGNPNVVGSEVIYNGKKAHIVGVIPESFDFGAMFAPGVRVDAFEAFPMTKETNRWGNTMAIVGRLKPGATAAAAEAELRAMAPALERLPQRNGLNPRVKPLAAHIRGNTRDAAWIVFASVLVVMLIVCANLASLQLARAGARRKEFSIRTALGAGRLRLVRQVVTECIVLAGAACVVATAFAWVATRTIANFDALRVPMLSLVRVDVPVALFAIGMCLVVGVLFGLMATFTLGRGAIHTTLKEAGRGASGSTRVVWLRKGLVVAEVGFACVLLVGAGLLLRGMMALLSVDLGFEPTQAWSMRIDFDQANPARFREALERVRVIQGVDAVAITDTMPLGRNRSWDVAPYERMRERKAYQSGYVRVVTDGYMKAMGLRMVEGREFERTDAPGAEQVIVVNEAMARKLWPGEKPLGRLMRVNGEKPWKVVGVVEDMRHLALDEPSGFEFYLPLMQCGDYNSLELAVRSREGGAALVSLVKQALQPLDPVIGLTRAVPVQELVDRSISPRRALALCLTGFAAFALLLASLGIYALIAYTVQQRRRELGIRMALGASATGLQWGVVRDTLLLVGLGVGLGVVTAIPTAQAMRGLLFGVEPGDPWSYAGMAACFLLVGLAASYLPARDVARIAPTEAIRESD